jgi:hypothetical protein
MDAASSYMITTGSVTATCVGRGCVALPMVVTVVKYISWPAAGWGGGRLFTQRGPGSINVVLRNCWPVLQMGEAGQLRGSQASLLLPGAWKPHYLQTISLVLLPVQWIDIEMLTSYA